MEMKEPCELETLAKSDCCAVGRCRHCGGMHLYLGPMTLRLNEETLLDLSDTLAAAARHLRDRRRDIQQDAGAGSPSPPARNATH